MQQSALLQITPILPPAMSGVGDYTALLGRTLRELANIESTYIVPSAEVPCPTPLAHQQIRIGRSTAQLRSTLRSFPRSTPLLLHYSGYGYHRHGIPRWLLKPLSEWVTEGGKLITVFHELAASGPPWRKSFYYGPLQRSLYRKLFALSAASITNTPITVQRLRALGDGPILFAPCFSMIGEPPLVPLTLRNHDTAIVFGLRAQRAAVYASVAAALPALRSLGVNRLLDIGPDQAVPTGFTALPVEQRGALSPAEVSACLANHTFALINYPATFLCKSGIFAACSSHGIVPLLLAPGMLPEPLSGGLSAGMHYLDLSAPLPLAPLERISEATYAWYQQHTLVAHAHDVAALLNRFVAQGPV